MMLCQVERTLSTTDRATSARAAKTALKPSLSKDALPRLVHKIVEGTRRDSSASRCKRVRGEWRWDGERDRVRVLRLHQVGSKALLLCCENERARVCTRCAAPSRVLAQGTLHTASHDG